jgi:hypothetical protein
VIGGYTLGGRHFDALIFGYWEGDRLMYAARKRSEFTPALREHLHQRFRGLETSGCPFANLPEARAGPWGEGLTAAKMKNCRWLRPELARSWKRKFRNGSKTHSGRTYKVTVYFDFHTFLYHLTP